MVAGSRANTVPESNHKNHMMACQRWEELQPCISPPPRLGGQHAAMQPRRDRVERGEVPRAFSPKTATALRVWRTGGEREGCRGEGGRMPERGRKDAKKRGRKAGACSGLCSQGRAARLPDGALGAFRGQSIPATGSFSPPLLQLAGPVQNMTRKNAVFSLFFPAPPSPPSLHKRHKAGLTPAARAVGRAQDICWPGVILKVTFLWP